MDVQLNTLYVVTRGATVRRDHLTLRVEALAEPDHEGRNRDVVHGDELGEVPGCIKTQPVPSGEGNEQKKGAQEPQCENARA